jgi:hypothetical protein
MSGEPEEVGKRSIPYALGEGTLDSYDCQHVENETGVRVRFRGHPDRNRGMRFLKFIGPEAHLDRAEEMARAMIDFNGKNGVLAESLFPD